MRYISFYVRMLSWSSTPNSYYSSYKVMAITILIIDTFDGIPVRCELRVFVGTAVIFSHVFPFVRKAYMVYVQSQREGLLFYRHCWLCSYKKCIQPSKKCQYWKQNTFLSVHYFLDIEKIFVILHYRRTSSERWEPFSCQLSDE